VFVIDEWGPARRLLLGYSWIMKQYPHPLTVVCFLFSMPVSIVYCGFWAGRPIPFWVCFSDNPQPPLSGRTYTHVWHSTVSMYPYDYGPTPPNRHQGRWHGDGRARYSNGDSYKGGYMFNQRHGSGVFKWHDGRVYKGMFIQDKRHGRVRSCRLLIFV
jgi:hypothetical protein